MRAPEIAARRRPVLASLAMLPGLFAAVALTGGASEASAQVVPAVRMAPAGPSAVEAPEAPEAPAPVLLVPGWGSNERALAPLALRLVASGWSPELVTALDFVDPFGSNLEHAREIAAAVDTLRARTGAARVDIVAHSMGGLATRLYLEDGGAAFVRRVVFIATPQRGTWTAYLAFGHSRDEMIPGSEFLESLNRGPAVPPGVEALTVRTWIDAHIVPETSATLPGVPDLRVCCPTHRGLLADTEVFRAIRAFLLTGERGVEVDR